VFHFKGGGQGIGCLILNTAVDRNPPCARFFFLLWRIVPPNLSKYSANINKKVRMLPKEERFPS
jgi:hypothetical protein